MSPADRAHRLIRPEAPWIGRRACSFDQRHLFFDSKYEGAAKAICSRCDVRSECLLYALANDEIHGIWGGLAAHERRNLPRARLSVTA